MHVTALTPSNRLLSTNMSMLAFLHGPLQCPGNTLPEDLIRDHLPLCYEELSDEELCCVIEEACVMAGAEPYGHEDYVPLRLHSVSLDPDDLAYFKQHIQNDTQLMSPDDIVA